MLAALFGIFALLSPAVAECPVAFLEHLQPDPSAFVNITYDYIIIGGGTAGVVLGARLAEDSNLQIGIIEAGQFHHNDPIIDVPHFAGQAVGNPKYDWLFQSTIQPEASNRQVPVPRGKMLGGSSGINSLAWTRASREEYNSWKMFAATMSWDWDGLVPFFKRSERIAFRPKNPYPGITKEQYMAAAETFTDVNGVEGPIRASLATFYPSPVSVVVKSLNMLGVRTNPDPQNGDATGIRNTLLSVDGTAGTRSYSPTGYYCGQPSRPNLHILLEAQATKILLMDEASSSGVTATGVQFYFGSDQYTVSSRHEIILAAGAIQTPQLLELSGIGNKTILETLEIPVLVDLPSVGSNLQEQLLVGMQWEVDPSELTYDILRNNITFAEEQMALYNRTGKGLYANSDSTTVFMPLNQTVTAERFTALLKVFDAKAALANPHSIETLQHPIQRSYVSGGDVAITELGQISSGLFTMLPNRSYISIATALLHPLSRGSVHISSNNPLDPPSIDMGYLKEDFDVQVLLDSLKFVNSLSMQSPMSTIITAQVFPDPTSVDMENNDDLIRFIRSTAAVGGTDHVIGTVPLGPRDKGGAVDPCLRVYGTNNVRVVDASIIPLHISAHTQSTVYAIAEKAVHIVRTGN